MLLPPLLPLLLLLAASAANAELVQLSRAEKQQILDEHNRVRVVTANGNTPGQPKAANMMLMDWDDRLQRRAENWASRCRIAHDTNEARSVAGYSWIGQNWAAGYRNDYSHYVRMWYNEYKDYNLATKTCSGVCGHYTQLVWADSLLVGCAVAKCQQYPHFLVCNYAPGGNYYDQQPYEVGQPATNCQGEFAFTEDGVCVRREQCSERGGCRCTIAAGDCENGAEFRADSCSCQCKQGFYGTRCEKVCENLPDWEYTCEAYGHKQCSVYAQYCPRSCDRCHTRRADAAAENSDRVAGRVVN